MAIIYINIVDIESLMFHVKFQNLGTSGSEVEEFFLKILAIYGHGGHLGHDRFYILMSTLLKEDPHKIT